MTIHQVTEKVVSERRISVVKLSKAFYFWSYIIAEVIAFFLNLNMPFEPGKDAMEWTNPTFIISTLFSFYGAIVAFLFIHRIWRLIPISYARTAPGKAVGFLFIPLYDFYWIFQVIYGWTKDFNKTVRNLEKNWDKAPETLGLVVSIVSAIVFFVILINPWVKISFKIINILSYVSITLFAVYISKVCDVINSIESKEILNGSSLGKQAGRKTRRT
jgi:hypothetical protein